MDYGRLFLFMAVATAVMAISTHLLSWVYSLASRLAIYWRIDHLRKQLEMDNLQEAEVERRRAVAPRYQTWERAMEDFRGDASLDDILDRLNGKFPPKATDLPKPEPNAPTSPEVIQSAISAPVTLDGREYIGTSGAVLTYFWGIDPSVKAVEELIKLVREKHGAPPPTPGVEA